MTSGCVVVTRVLYLVPCIHGDIPFNNNLSSNGRGKIKKSLYNRCNTCNFNFHGSCHVLQILLLLLRICRLNSSILLLGVAFIGHGYSVYTSEQI